MKRPLALITILFLAVSCSSIHDFPDDMSPWNPAVTVNINVSLQSDPISVYPTANPTYLSESGQRRHFIVEAWEEIGEGKAVIANRTELFKDINDDTNLKLSIKLDARKYRIAIWQDLVDMNGYNRFYTTASLEDIHLQEPASYIGDTDEKDCSSTVISVDLTPYSNRKSAEVSVTGIMERPLSKLEFTSTDAADFLLHNDIRKMSARIVYTCNLPTRYNAVKGELTDTRAGYSCSTSLEAVSANEVRLGFDYILTDAYETHIYAMIYVYDENGNEACHAGPYYTPLRHGYVTEMREKYLK